VAVVVVAALLKVFEGKDDDTGEDDPSALSETAKGWLFLVMYATLHRTMTATA
jgi:hypothetical protein